jgi:hypothetical protein
MGFVNGRLIAGAVLTIVLCGCASDQPGSGAKSTQEMVASPQPVIRALVAGDGRKIFVSAGGGGCTRHAGLTATATSEAVTLHLNTYTPNASEPCTSESLVLKASVTLAVPLGSRRLVDGDTAKAIPYIDGSTLAAVGWLPDRASKPVNSLSYGWTRTYRFPGKPAVPPLMISQGPPNLVDTGELRSSSYVVSHPIVRARVATLVTQSDGLAWVVNDTMYLVASEPVVDSQQPLSPNTLEHIARSLRIPGSEAQS